jgi:hypothetical protein
MWRREHLLDVWLAMLLLPGFLTLYVFVRSWIFMLYRTVVAVDLGHVQNGK